MIIDCAYFMTDKAERDEMLFYTELRNFTLDILTSLKGYKEASLEVKNETYDLIKKNILKALNK